MTDRYNALIVVLQHDIREDDIKGTVEAIRHIKGVIDIKLNRVDSQEAIARIRIKSELYDKILALFYEPNDF